MSHWQHAYVRVGLNRRINSRSFKWKCLLHWRNICLGSSFLTLTDTLLLLAVNGCHVKVSRLLDPTMILWCCFDVVLSCEFVLLNNSSSRNEIVTHVILTGWVKQMTSLWINMLRTRWLTSKAVFGEVWRLWIFTNTCSCEIHVLRLLQTMSWTVTPLYSVSLIWAQTCLQRALQLNVGGWD